MYQRIEKKFIELRIGNRKALIPYMSPEYPLRGCTLPVLRALDQAGADLIEVGIPFSDPLADGPTIQHSSMVAIGNGVTVRGIFASVKEFRAESQTPVIAMGYSNPLIRYGVKDFCRDAVEAGIDGIIVPDMPPEEAENLRTYATATGLGVIFLIAPTSTPERIRMLDELSTGYVYCVSITGVTGSQHDFGHDQNFLNFMDTVRNNTTKPFVVGFGISTREDVERIWRLADGVVVGSALIGTLRNCRSVEEAATSAGTFLKSLRPDITLPNKGTAMCVQLTIGGKKSTRWIRSSSGY
jgi:tryptophan synthase alpha chain